MKNQINKKKNAIRNLWINPTIYLISILCILGCHSQEPEHQGKTLSQWVADLKSPESSTRLNAINALGSIDKGATPAIPALCAVLRDDPDPSVSGQAAFILSRLEVSEEILPELIQLLSHSELARRQSAASVIAAIGPQGKAAVPALMQNLRDLNGKARSKFLFALRYIGPNASEAIPLLEEIFKTDPEASWDAQRALEKIRDKPSAQR